MQRILFTHYKNAIENCVSEEFKDMVSVEPPKNEAFGDFSTNIAMILAKKVRRAPIEIANEIAEKLKKNEDFSEISVKAPGFINWRVPRHVFFSHFPTVLDKNFGKINLGKWKKVNIEYVSANPTGPMHAGHARGAVSGDVLANLMKFVGYDVTKEYYINDAGNQINILAKSLYYRYLEQCGKAEGSLPEWAYPGDYLIDTAKKIYSQHGDKYVDKDESEWIGFFKEFAIQDMMALIKEDLKDLGIQHDVFSSELKLVKDGAVDRALKYLEDNGLVYLGVLDSPKGREDEDWEEREHLLFRSTKFGDDVDRVLKKSDGSWTYFASDIAYHMDKINRGFEELIDFWGADHGGYVKRMQAAVSAISNSTRELKVQIVQLVRFMKDGQEVRMSKRAGTFVTVRDVLDNVGRDVIRFMMLTRRDDAPLDFDFQKVVEQSKENPVFYVQYAYARTHSVLKQFFNTFSVDKIPEISSVNLNLLEDADLEILKILLDWPRQIAMAANKREPHRIAFYLMDLAAKFHFLWNLGKDNTIMRFILADDFEKTAARMVLLKAVQNVIEIAFEIMGITPVEELR